jgi:hypothetical protein
VPNGIKTASRLRARAASRRTTLTVRGLDTPEIRQRVADLLQGALV